MMYFLLILFFGSLIGITFMIGRKLVVLQNNEALHESGMMRDAYLEELKNSSIKNIKKYSYLGLVGTIRLYVHSVDFLKKKYETTKVKIKKIREKRRSINGMEKREVSKFLKLISEYRYKIRKIKHQIKKEEENM